MNRSGGQSSQIYADGKDQLPDSPVFPALQVRGLSKSFGSTLALKDASIDVARGEVHVLLGENGAGKSTMAKIIAGIHAADAGEILIDGVSVAPRNAREAREFGIAIVFQDMSLAPHLTVAENLFLGAERVSQPFSILQRRAERRRASEILQELSIDLPLDELVGHLSVGKKQQLEIAKALLQRPRILILDEPTSALTEREKSFLFSMIRKLQSDGTAILYVTHHLREVFEIGNRVSAMRDGCVTGTVSIDGKITERNLIEILTGRRFVSEGKRSRYVGKALLEVVDIHSSDGCCGIDFTLRQSEVVGIYGVVGSGREALARVLVGIAPPTQGEMTLAGRPYIPRNPARAAALGVGYLATDRHRQGILPRRSIRENLTLSTVADHARFGFIVHRTEQRMAGDRLQALRARFSSMEDPITSLSGGNQQKVLFGRALGRRPKLLVMEDPTAGIDVTAKFDLHHSIRMLAAEGHSFLLLSSDLPETLSLCDRVYTIYRGRMTDEIVGPTAADEGRILAGILGNDRETAGLPPRVASTNRVGQ